MTPATRKTDAIAEAVFRASMDRANRALMMLGSQVGSKMYEEIKGLWAARFCLWLNRGDCTGEDVWDACGALSTPEALSQFEFASQVNAALALAIGQARNARIERLRAEAEKREESKWTEEYTARQRAEVVRLLATVGTRVGKDRRTQQRGNTSGKGQDRTPEEVAAQEQAEGRR